MQFGRVDSKPRPCFATLRTSKLRGVALLVGTPKNRRHVPREEVRPRLRGDPRYGASRVARYLRVPPRIVGFLNEPDIAHLRTLFRIQLLRRCAVRV